MADDLAPWLLQQLARDEQAARALPNAIGDLQSRFSPVKLTADCEAKRRIVGECEAVLDAEQGWEYDDAPRLADRTLRLLALPYADRPGYREEWRP